MSWFISSICTRVTVIIAVGMTCGCCAHCPASASRGEVPKIIVPPENRPQRPLDCYVPGIENFGFVSAEVWRGARPTARGYQSLCEMRVRTIIDLELPG